VCGTPHSRNRPIKYSTASRSSAFPESRTSVANFSTAAHGTSSEIEESIPPSNAGSDHPVNDAAVSTIAKSLSEA
jgi:hypothetical protein